jgi:hypothetical protein
MGRTSLSKTVVVAVQFSVLLLRPGAGRAAEAPADGWVIWQSYRADSRSETYRARADGSEVTRLTQQGSSVAQWSPDGRWIAYSNDVSEVYVIRPDGSDARMLSSAGNLTFWLHDNSGVVVTEGDAFVLVDPDTGERSPFFNRSEFPQFAGTTFQPNSMTHDNRYLLLGSHLFINGYTAANGSFKSEYSAMLVDMAHKDRVYFLGTGCWPFTPPEGDLVYHICGERGGCPTFPDIYRMHLADMATRSSYEPEVAHPDPDWGHEYNPRVSNDNKWISYMATTGCHAGGCDYEIFLHRLGAGPEDRVRVTNDPLFDGYPDIHIGPLWAKSEQPRLLVTPNRLGFEAQGGQAPAARILKVKNDGGGTLGVVSTHVDPPAPWLTVESTAGQVSVQVSPTGGLAAGSQRVMLTIEAAGSAPVTVPVSVTADDSFPPPDAGVPGPEAGAPVTPPAPSSSGCHCALTRARPAAVPWSPLLLFAALLLRRRRR